MSMYSFIMPRTKSHTRRIALLDAAVQVFAEHGLSGPISLVSRRAGVSEGSLFTYFPTKNVLILATYREVREQMVESVMDAYPRRGTVRERLWHVWERYVSWGVDNPAERECLRHCAVSPIIPDEARAEPTAMFVALVALERDAVEQGLVKSLPEGMAGQVIRFLGEMTRELIRKRPQARQELIETGFTLLWDALAR